MKKKSSEKDMFRITVNGLIAGEDINVVTDTPFEDNATVSLNGIMYHKPNYRYAKILGLGIILEEDYTFFYEPYIDDLVVESLKTGVYYQLTHPNHDDKDLEELLFGVRGGAAFLKKIQHVDTDELIEELKFIFQSKKGNVLPFRCCR